MWIEKTEVQTLIEILHADDFTVVGPKIEQDAIVYRELRSSTELPVGWRDRQSPGHYRVVRTGESFFEFNVGPQSWKQYLFPPRRVVSSAPVFRPC